MRNQKWTSNHSLGAVEGLNVQLIALDVFGFNDSLEIQLYSDP